MLISASKRLEAEVGRANGAAKKAKHVPDAETPANWQGNGEFNLFREANALDTIHVLDLLSIAHSSSTRGEMATCPGCGEDGALVCEKGGVKCLHDRCGTAGPPANKGFRTNVDLESGRRCRAREGRGGRRCRARARTTDIDRLARDARSASRCEVKKDLEWAVTKPFRPRPQSAPASARCPGLAAWAPRSRSALLRSARSSRGNCSVLKVARITGHRVFVLFRGGPSTARKKRRWDMNEPIALHVAHSLGRSLQRVSRASLEKAGPGAVAFVLDLDDRLACALLEYAPTAKRIGTTTTDDGVLVFALKRADALHLLKTPGHSGNVGVLQDIRVRLLRDDAPKCITVSAGIVVLSNCLAVL